MLLLLTTMAITTVTHDYFTIFGCYRQELCAKFWKIMRGTFDDYVQSFLQITNAVCSYLLYCCYINTKNNSLFIILHGS